MRNLDINQFAAILQSIHLPRIIKLVEAGITHETLEIEVYESLGQSDEVKELRSEISDGHVLLSFLYAFSSQSAKGHTPDNLC